MIDNAALRHIIEKTSRWGLISFAFSKEGLVMIINTTNTKELLTLMKKYDLEMIEDQPNFKFKLEFNE